MSIYDVLKREQVSNYINHNNNFDSRTKEELKKQAINYLNNLETNLNHNFYNFCYYPVKSLFRKVNRVVDNAENLRQVLKSNNTVIYALNHKSLLDVLLFPVVLQTEQRNLFKNTQKIKNPRSIAGTNITKSFVGSILRDGWGSIPIDRQNKDPLYLIIFKNYVSYLLENDQDLIVYYEGGRSYSGELKKPKLLWLNSALESSSKNNIVVLPVALNYDLILEERILTKIKEKKNQRRFDNELLELAYYGLSYSSTFYTSFANPVYLKDFNVEEKVTLSNIIFESIKNNITITPTNITAKAIADLQLEESIHLSKLEEKVAHYYNIFKQKSLNIKYNSKEAVMNGIKRLKGRAINITNKIIRIKNIDIIKYYSNSIDF